MESSTTMGTDTNDIRDGTEKESLTIQEQFFRSVKDGNISVFMDMLKRKGELEIDLESQDANGDTALKLAIKTGYSVLVQQLLKHDIQVSDALLKSVDVGFAATVKVICEYAQNLPTHDRRIAVLECHCEDEEFHPDVTPIILAAQRNDFTIVQILLNAGANIPENLKGVSARSTDSLQKSTGLLEVYRGLASEAYVSLKYEDPVDRAFVLSNTLQKLSKTEVTYKSSYLELAETLNQVGPDIVSCARSTDEILTVLSHHVGNDGENMDMGPLPTLSRAIQFDQRQFVAQPNCQQAVKSKFYGVLSSIRDRSSIYRLFLLLSMIVTFPLLSLSYLYVPSKFIRTRMECPYVKFVMHLASDVYFITLVTADVIIKEELAYTYILTRPTRALLLVWIIGIGWQVFSALKNDQSVKLTRSKHFRNTVLVATFLIGACLDVTSYYSIRASNGFVSLQSGGTSNTSYETLNTYIVTNVSSETLYRFPKSADVLPISPNVSSNSNVTLLKRVSIMPSYRRAQISRGSTDEPETNANTQNEYDEEASFFMSLVWWHPHLIATAMFSIMTVMALLRMLPYLAVNDTVGSLQISLWSMISKTSHFFLVLIVVILSFAVGLTYIYAYYNATDHQLCVLVQGKDNCTIGPLTDLFWVTIYLYWSMFGLEDSNRLLLSNQAQTMEYAGFLLYGLFFVLVVVVLLNALIAVMTEVYNDIETNADIEWKFASTSMWLTYMQKGDVVPPPFNLLPSMDDFVRLLKFAKKELRPRRPLQLRCSERQQRIKFEGLRMRRRSTSTYEKSQYQRVISRLVERYISSKMTDDLNAESDVSISDIRELRNDLLSLKFDIFQKVQDSVEQIARVIGKGNHTYVKSKDTNSVFRRTDLIHSIVKGHLKDVRKFTKELEATIASIPDPPETTEKESQTSHCGIIFDHPATDEAASIADSVQVATTGSQTSSQWMDSKRTQTKPPGMNETAMQTSRDYLQDEQCQTVKAPETPKTDASTQISRFFELIPNGNVSHGHRGHAKSKKKLLSCLYPGSAVQYEAYQTSSSENVLQNGGLKKPGVSDCAIQTMVECLTDTGQQTSKDDLEDTSNNNDGDDKYTQTTGEFNNQVSQTEFLVDCSSQISQTTEDLLTDNTSQTSVLEVHEEITQTSLEYLSDASSQTPTPLPTKEASLQTINAILSDTQVQVVPDVHEVKIQTSREFLTEVYSQTKLLPAMREVPTQTTKESLSDSMIQTTVIVQKETSIQTSRDYAIDVNTQTRIPPVVVEAKIQTDAKRAKDNVAQTDAPPDVAEIQVQTTTEHLVDGTVQTESIPTLDYAMPQTAGQIITEELVSDNGMVETNSHRRMVKRMLSETIASKVKIFDDVSE